MAGKRSCIFGKTKNENQIFAVKNPSHSYIQFGGERGHGRHFVYYAVAAPARQITPKILSLVLLS